MQRGSKCDLAKELMDKWQSHWSTRHSLHVWDKLDLSRSQFETLRHLLSFIYDPAKDAFVPIKVWEDPDDPRSSVVACALASRWKREALYNEIADESGIIVSAATGRCERDSEKLINAMYSNFQGAMRSDFSAHRPAQPFFYCDGTGGSLGKGIGHAEIGSADFSGTVKQSRATLSPLALYEGTDHAEDQRSNMPIAAASYNKAIKKGSIDREDGTSIPSRPGASGDLQAIKAYAAQEERSHSPWCRDCIETQHAYGDDDFEVSD